MSVSAAFVADALDQAAFCRDVFRIVGGVVSRTLSSRRRLFPREPTSDRAGRRDAGTGLSYPVFSRRVAAAFWRGAWRRAVPFGERMAVRAE